MSGAMSVREVAEYLNVDEKTVFRLVKRGEFPGVKVGPENDKLSARRPRRSRPSDLGGDIFIHRDGLAALAHLFSEIGCFKPQSIDAWIEEQKQSGGKPRNSKLGPANSPKRQGLR